MKKLPKDTKLLLFENMVKLNSDFKLTEADKKWIQNAVNPEHKGFCTPMTKSTCTPARKALAKRFKKGIDEELSLNNEVKVQQNDTYFETLSAALDAVRERVEKKGYTVDENEMFTQFGTGGINYLETKRATISLLRNGIPDKRRSVTIAIYRMDSGKYELTAYMN
jgi:hypothetical protein